MTYDKIILGAGLYGLYAAQKCGAAGQRVLVLERDPAPFMRATYINQARVNHSKKLLTATAMPLIDIANECCFGDQSYFSRVFKKYQGVSPKKYRDDLSQRS